MEIRYLTEPSPFLELLVAVLCPASATLMSSAVLQEPCPSTRNALASAQTRELVQPLLLLSHRLLPLFLNLQPQHRAAPAQKLLQLLPQSLQTLQQPHLLR